tara:strand:- start:169 stop:567 length:399 start_codon:yes stop_codon:yes gene_type:complete
MQNFSNFNCPNCKSTKFITKTTIGKKYIDGPYKDVNSEIQCAECFMDIPSNISENIKKNDLDNCHKLWNEVYKPAHKLNAAKCSKCYLYYWEIERNLFVNNISLKDIFYQTYNPQKGGGSLICKICDPSAFK